MATTNFYLDNKKDRPLSLIFLYFRYSKRILKYNTKLRINAKDWNKEKQRIRRSHKYSKDMNSFLASLEGLVYPTYLHLLAKLGREPENKELKYEVNVKLNRLNKVKEATFVEYIKSHIESLSGIKREGTIKHYKTTYNRLVEYQKQKKTTLYFSSINQKFNNDFVQFLQALNIADNTIGVYIKNVKLFMNAAYQENLHANLTFKRFKVVKDGAAQPVYLSETELNTLYHYNLEDNERLERVRDSFIVACFTGLRFGDLIRLRKSNVIQHNGKQIISILTSKTKTKVEIPIHPYVSAILDKYGGQMPKSMTNQKMNEYLKELCKMVGFNKSHQKILLKANQQVIEELPKYKLISTHTARRSFATNAYLAGIPSKQIMDITGHKKESTFLKYVRVSKKESATKLSNHAFFNT